MVANIAVSEPKQPEDPDSALSFSMEGALVGPPPSLTPAAWAPAWNSNQSINKFQAEIGGHLQGGDPGIRIIKSGSAMAWSNAIPSRPDNGSDRPLIPQQHIFGSEELSHYSPGIAERTPDLYLSLNPKDAVKLKLSEGDQVELRMRGRPVKQSAVVRVDSGIPAGAAGAPLGFPGTFDIEWLGSVEISKLEKS